MIRRDKNHPSIIMWSMANECKSETKIGIKVLRELLFETKQLDKSRLATFVARLDTENERAFEYADIVCYNMYYGSVLGEICHHASQMNKRVKIASLKFIKKQHKHFPTKPKLITEFGCRAIKNISGDMHISEDIQAGYLEKAWEVISSYKHVSGGVVWSWADYYHQKNFDNVTVFGPWGVVTVDRRPKKALQTLKRMFGEGN
jgi:beta-glucuronidase